MPVDASRIQGFGSSPAPSRKNEQSSLSDAKDKFFNALEAAKDTMATPAVQSAVDNVTLRVSDAWESATQDVSEMALNVKSYVSSTLGTNSSTSKSSKDVAEEKEEKFEKQVNVSPRHLKEAKELILKFCVYHRPTRVAPTMEELETLWVQCSILQPAAVGLAFTEQISYSSGDYAWQPRIRALYALENFYARGGPGKDVADIVHLNSVSVIQHLCTEVPQTKEKANEVLAVLRGEKQPEPVPERPAEKKSPGSGSKKKQEPTVDLLDFTTPSPPATSSKANPKDESLDLLSMGMDSAPATASPALTQDLLGSVSTSAPRLTQGPSDMQFDPSEPPKVSPSSPACMAAFAPVSQTPQTAYAPTSPSGGLSAVFSSGYADNRLGMQPKPASPAGMAAFGSPSSPSGGMASMNRGFAMQSMQSSQTANIWPTPQRTGVGVGMGMGMMPPTNMSMGMTGMVPGQLAIGWKSPSSPGTVASVPTPQWMAPQPAMGSQSPWPVQSGMAGSMNGVKPGAMSSKSGAMGSYQSRPQGMMSNRKVPSIPVKLGDSEKPHDPFACVADQAFESAKGQGNK